MAISSWVVHSLMHSGGEAFAPITRTVKAATNYLVPNEIPPIDTIIELATRGWISEPALTLFARLQGVPIDPTDEQQFEGTHTGLNTLQKLWNDVYYAAAEIPTAVELGVLRNRGRLTDNQLDWYLTKHGYSDHELRADVASLRYEIPSSSDLVRFSVRHVFEPDLIAKLQYNDEFQPILDIFHRFQGLNYPIFTGPFKEAINEYEVSIGLTPEAFYERYLAVGLEDPTWAQAFWWSHWVLPSPSQGYEMYFRLRPDRDRTFDPEFARGLNFSLDDLNLLLRANDYPPYYRDALAAIAHRVPGVRFMRELLRTGTYVPKQVYELLRRQGYSDGDSTALTLMLAKSDADAKGKAADAAIKKWLAKYFLLGMITDGDYRDILRSKGVSAAGADAIVELGQVERSALRAQRVIAFVRRQVLSGRLDRLQANAQLNQAGVLDPQLSDYLDEWELELRGRRKEISAASAIKLACSGLITLGDLQARLVNLGYGQEDIVVLSAEAAQCAQDRGAKLVATAVKQVRQREADLKRAQNEAAKTIKDARRALASHGSPAQLRKWYCDGHVSQAEVFSRLTYLGWPDADIARLIADCRATTGSGTGGSGGKRGPAKP